MSQVQIFISYAREDGARVKQLYQRLVDEGFHPWLDREHIVPGMRWEPIIKLALKQSDFVLVCLSATSINKRGFLQREIKQALEQAGEKLDCDVYLIPARLDDCEVPDALSGIQWVDLFAEDGWDSLMRAIAHELKQRGKSMPTIGSSIHQATSLDLLPKDGMQVKSLVDFVPAQPPLPSVIQPSRTTPEVLPTKAIERELVALKTSIDRKKKQEIAETKAEFKPLEVFISYSHRDEALREELGKHLSALRRENVIGFWHDRMIGAGAEWRDVIDRHLEQAGIILLLVSPDFIASEYCYDIEMRRALERHAAGEAVVIPIVLRPVDWLNMPLAELQSLPRDNKAVTLWANLDAAFVEIAKGIRQAVEQLMRPSAAPESKSKPEAKGAPRFITKQIQRPPTRILHLSDLHFGADDDPIVRLQPLVSDLRDRREGLGIESLDYLVISGDLTNRGAYEEFERVHDFLSDLVKEMKLTAERTIIVPGNHDLSWDEEVYVWMQERNVNLNKLPPYSYVRQGKGYLVRDDALYPTRFKNFARFHHQFKQLEYSLKPEAQSLSVLFEETGIQFLALNSAWMIDEYHPDRSRVNEKALAKGLIEADRRIEEAKNAKLMKDDASVLRIAVWHHPATGNEKIADDDFIEKLRKADFKLCLHGHVHEDRADLVGYLHPTRKLHMAGAGSFGAVAVHRPPSTPRLYNLIEIPRDHNVIRVHTRCMRKESGAWDGWAVWPGDNAFDKKAFYEIKLK